MGGFSIAMLVITIEGNTKLMHGLVMIGECVVLFKRLNHIKPTTPSKMKKLERNITWEPPCMQSTKVQKTHWKLIQ